MSLTFTSGFSKPSGIIDKPGNLERPAFETLYGFDTPQEEVAVIYNIEDIETEAVVLASTPTNPSGEVTVKFGSDTFDLYVWDGSVWFIYNNDYTP
jgi:hypothetical protein